MSTPQENLLQHFSLATPVQHQKYKMVRYGY
jgi:hypothetical protein